ncbi:hypothetical protein [Kribbella deserti]|uniref:DUF4179 domain-containing protein n=1 Tax=Kribbella deserti TaxID=1926257 RepID=A0ABV6QR61_9ACTN
MSTTNQRLRELNPVSDGELAGRISPQAHDELVGAIMRTGSPERSGVSLFKRPVVRRVVPALAAAGLAAAFTIIPIGGGSTEAAALSFSRSGEYLIVRVIDPYADTAKYNAEFKKQGLDVQMTTSAASPSSVGQLGSIRSTSFPPGKTQLTNEESPLYKVKFTSEPELCNPYFTDPCQTVIKIPLDFKANLQLEFGRKAKPGEAYDMPGSLEGIGEPLHGLQWRNKTVAEVRALLASRNTVIAGFYPRKAQAGVDEHHAPDDWLVADGRTQKLGEAHLDVYPRGTQP